MTIEKVKEYFEIEYHLMKASVSSICKKDAYDNIQKTIQRCLGASYLAQMNEIDYCEVASAYKDIKRKLEALLTED